MATESADIDLATEFAGSLARLMKEWRQKPFAKGYFPGQVESDGPLRAVEHYVLSPDQPLFYRICENLGPGSTVERLVLLPKYRLLFSEKVQRVARERLVRAGWTDPSGLMPAVVNAPRDRLLELRAAQSLVQSATRTTLAR